MTLCWSQVCVPVLSENSAPVAIRNRASVTFTSGGSITALGAGDDPTDIKTMGRLKLVNRDTASLVRGGDGLFRVGPGNGVPAPADPEVSIASGFVEKSNVSPAQAMVGMIGNARRFEMQMKIISDASSNEERANSILSVSR